MTPSTHRSAQTSPAASPMDLTALLRQADWLQGLARSLVKDGNEAEDVWQEALQVARTKLAGGGPGAEQATSRPWLAGVVRNVARSRARRDRQRRAREACAAQERLARSSSSPSPLDDLELVEGQGRLLEQIGTLPRAQRRVLLARFYEGLAPREIAAQSGAPVSTVKSQIQRGLEALRLRLDAEHGDRRAWAAWLLPVASPAAGVSGSSGAMTAAAGFGLGWIVIAATALLAAGLFVWQGLNPGEPLNQAKLAGLDPLPSAAIDPEDPTALVSQEGTTRQAAPSTPAAARTADLPGSAAPKPPRIINAEDLLPDPGSGATGALALRILQQGTSLPAPHVYANLFPSDGQSLAVERRPRYSDQDGLASWPNLHPGRYRLLDRTVEIRGSGVTDLAIEIPWGAVIRGVVVDMQGQPVHGARVGGENSTFTLSDHEGRFALRGAGNVAWVGATAEGYQRSTVDVLHRNAWTSREVKLRMARGGASIFGRVIAGDGTHGESLLAGVTVRAKELERYRAKDDLDYNLGGATCVSDESGHFELTGLLPVPHEITIQITGLSEYKQTVQVAPEEQIALDLRLPQPSGDWAASKGQARAPAKNQPPGVEREGYLSASFSVSFVDANGAPLKGWSVIAYSEQAEHLLGFTNDQGRLRTEQAKPWMQHLGICPPGFVGRPLQTFPGAGQSTSPLSLTVTERTGTIRGRVSDTSGVLPTDADVHLARINGIHKTLEPSGPDGSFEFPGVPPGTYEVRYQATGRAVRAIPVDLRPGQTLDLGELISSPGGFVELELDGARPQQPGGPPEGPHSGQPTLVYVMAGDGPGFAWSPTAVDPITSLVGPLPEGELHLSILGVGCGLTHVKVHVKTGRTAKAYASLEKGFAAPVRLTISGRDPAGSGTGGIMVSYEIEDLDTGAHVGSFGGAAVTSAFELTPLFPGRYRVRAADGQGREGEAIVTVPEGGARSSAPPELRLEPLGK